MLSSPQVTVPSFTLTHSIWTLTETEQRRIISPPCTPRSLKHQSREPYFGQAANFSPHTLVVGSSSGVMMTTTTARIQHLQEKMKSHCNAGFGMVPITNTFTSSPSTSTAAVSSSMEDSHEIDRMDLTRDLTQSNNIQIRKMSAKNLHPPSPALPTASDQHRFGLVLYQIGFTSGRQALFQGLFVARSGESLHLMVNEFVVLGQDDGVEIGIFRAFEPISELVPNIPEVPFMPILRRAKETEIHALERKREEEESVLALAKKLVRERPCLVNQMEIESCEFQFDHNKLIVYAQMKKWVKFNEFVKALHALIENEMGHQTRVFVQRRFAAPPTTSVVMW